MLETLLSLVSAKLYTIIGVAGLGGLLGLILRKFIKKDTITKNLDEWLRENGKYVRKAFGGFGRVVTLNATRWPVVGGLWNKIVEPFLIFFVQLLFKTVIWFVHNAVEGFINQGLLSDNPNYAGETKKQAKATARAKD